MSGRSFIYITNPFFFVFTEVIRTRLREEGSKYKYFFQTGRLIAVEEGYAAFYRGLIPQLIRQIPNTAIVLSTYELIVYLLGDSKWTNAWRFGISWQMDARENPKTQETFGIAPWKYGAAETLWRDKRCTVIQRAKYIILLKSLSFIRITQVVEIFLWMLPTCEKRSSS